MRPLRASKMFGLFLASYVLFFADCDAASADEPKPSFQATKNHIDRVVGREEPDVEFVGIQNTGKTVIKEIKYEGEFTNPKSGATVLIPPAVADLPSNGIQPSDHFSIKVKMCKPVWAGSYSGALVLTSPGADSKSIGIVIRSRGPLPDVPFGKSAFYELPAILFIVVVLVGFGVSWLLDQWMGTDLPRLRALQSLRNSQTTLLNMSDRIRKWPLDHPSLSAFPLTLNRMAILVPDLTRVVAGASQATPADLTATGQTYSLVSAKLLTLSSALDLIESLYSQKGNDPLNLAYLNSAIKRLDALDFSDASPIATFRSNVVNALSVSTATGIGGIMAAPATANAAVTQTVQLEATQRKIERDIRLITLAQHAVVWVIVVLTGLTTYFLANATYGSAADYIGTLLWSLGLTQTGKQIIARPR
jgi:hypothetical protein